MKYTEWWWNSFIAQLKIGVALCATPGFLLSQNLILNPSLEDTVSCPLSMELIHKAKGWFKFENIWGTPDLFHTCSNDAFASIPSPAGFQYPKSGNGMLHQAGFARAAYDSLQGNFLLSTGSEYIQYRETSMGTLTEPLLAKQQYKFSVFTNFCEKSIYNIPSGTFNVVFLEDTLHPTCACPPYLNDLEILDLNPSHEIVEDTAQWVELSLCYTAKGGERYFAIGVFVDSSQIVYKYGGAFSSEYYLSRYYFDSFSLIECDTCCGAELPESVLFGPNPSTADKPGVFTFFVSKEQSAILTLYDSAGRLVYRYTHIPEGQSTLPFPQNLAMGVYHYVFESNSGFKDRGKILVGD